MPEHGFPLTSNYPEDVVQIMHRQQACIKPIKGISRTIAIDLRLESRRTDPEILRQLSEEITTLFDTRMKELSAAPQES